MLSESLSAISSEFPGCDETIKAILALDKRVGAVSLDSFFEPVSATIESDGKQRLLNIRPDDLNSWVQHIGQGTHCRLRAIEGPVVSCLAAGRILAAMALLRSHIEAAALAAYCLDQLTSSIRTQNLDALGDLIPKTLFGTSMKKLRSRPEIHNFLSFFEGETIRICRAIEALDKYYYQEHADGKFVMAYSLLCEYAHPNHRGVMHMISAEERAQGWLISYQLAEMRDLGSVSGPLEILLVSMRAGYSAGQLLRCWRFDEHHGELTWRGPNATEADAIWSEFLQRPPGADR